MKKNNTIFKKSTLSSAILCAMGSAQAAVINIQSGCTLGDAIQAANTDAVVGSCTAGSADDVIQFITPDSGININTVFEASSFNGNVGLPIITSNVTIEGEGLTVFANNSTEDFRLFEVGAGGDLTLRDTTVTGADDGLGQGSGLLAYYGRVSLENTTFAQNNGGVMLVGSNFSVITNTVIRHNGINSFNFGAGLTSILSILEITDSSFIENEFDVPLPFRGGSGSPFMAGGASLFQSEVTIRNSTFSGNKAIYGSGLTITSDAPAPLPSKFPQLDNSPLRGMIQNEVTITNSTVTNNTAYIGAGILDLSETGSLTLQGNIIAGNQAFAAFFGANIYSQGLIPVNMDANNIIGDDGQAGTYGVTLGPSDHTFSNYTKDNLYPLTLTNGQLVHPLKEGSPAIDGGVLSCYGSLTDQEGKSRGIDGDNDGSFICDVGAFEHSLSINADGTPCTFENAMLSANTDSSVGGCQPGNGHDIINLPTSSSQTAANIQYTNPYDANFGFAEISSAITIEGNGSTISKDVAAVDAFDLLNVAPGAQLNLLNTTISGADGAFGAVSTWSGGNVNLLDSNISNNLSRGLFDYGSINSSVVNSTISQNVPDLLSGIGAGYAAGMATIISTGFELRQSTISNNIGGIGGGADLRSVSGATIENSTLSGNTATTYGGLIFTTVSGLISEIKNSTITGNQGQGAGGAILYGSENAALILSQSVVSGNELVMPPPGVEVANSLGLVGVNGGGGPTPIEINANPYLTLDAYNIIGQNGDSGTVGATLGASDQVPVGATSTVIESTLADNGGATLTHLPVDGGLAVDGGTSFCGLKEDQTGRIRPWDGNADGDDVCDVGAVELGSIYASDIIFKDGFDAFIIVRRHSLKE